MARRKTEKTDEALASLKYGEARDRLETLLESLERNEVDLDDLSDKVKEAAGLIRVLNDKLLRTKTEVEKVLADVEEEAPAVTGDVSEDEDDDST